MKLLLSLIFFCAITSLSCAQSITWEKQYHYGQNSSVRCAVETADSGYLVPANVLVNNVYQIWMLKVSKYGHVVWRKYIADGYDEYSFVKRDKGIYSLVLYQIKTDPVTNLSIDGMNIFEFNENGDLIWQQNHWDDIDIFAPNTLFPLNHGSYVLISYLYGHVKNTSDYPPIDMLVQRYNSSHQLVWSDTFDFIKQPQRETGSKSILMTHDKKLLIAGNAGPGNSIQCFSYMLLLDTNGKTLNYVPFSYDQDSSEFMDYVTQLEDGKIVTESATWSWSDTYITLCDSVGNVLKSYTAGGQFPHGTGGFAADADSFMLFASVGLLDGPMVLNKYDNDFNLIWSKKFDDTVSYDNTASQIFRTSDGGLLLVGNRQVDASNNPDMVLIKLDAQGNLAHVDYSGIDAPNGANSSSCDMVFPNPAQGWIRIGQQPSSLPKEQTLEIYDAKGARVFQSRNTFTSLKKQDISFLNKGLYMYRLFDENGEVCNGRFMKE